MRSVGTAMEVFEAIARHQPIGLSALAREVGAPKATVQRCLNTLAGRRWIVQDLLGAGRWTVSVQHAFLAEPPPRLQTVRSVVHPLLPGLRERIGGHAALFTIDGDRMVMIDGYEGAKAVTNLEAQLGRFPIHASGAGRAMLAALTASRQRELIARLHRQGMAAYTARTTVDPDALSQAVREARRLGWAVVDGEFLPSITTVGAAITGPGGAPVAAISAITTDPATPGALRAIGREVAATAKAATDELGRQTAL